MLYFLTLKHRDFKVKYSEIKKSRIQPALISHQIISSAVALLRLSEITLKPIVLSICRIFGRNERNEFAN